MSDDDRWPTHWFERLILGMKLNDAEWREYCISMKANGIRPDFRVRETKSSITERQKPS